MTEIHPAPYEPDLPPSAVDWASSPSPAGDAGWYPEEGGGLDVRSLLEALVRYKWILVVAGILGVGAAYLVYSRFQDTYVAYGSIWVQAQSGSVEDGTSGPLQPGGLLPSTSWLELLQSYTLLEPVVRNQQLYLSTANPDDLALFEDVDLIEDDEDEEPRPIRAGEYAMTLSADGRTVRIEDGDGGSIEAPVGTPIGEELGVTFVPNLDAEAMERPVVFSLVSLREAAGGLQDGLNQQIDQRGSFITLDFTARDPQRAADVVNDVMDRLQELAGELKNQSMDEEYNILADQLEAAEARLAAAEEALESFRVGTITLPSENQRPIQAGIEATRDPVFDEYFANSIRLEEVRRDRARLEQVAAEIETSGVRIPALEAVPSASQSTQVQAAIEDYVAAQAERTTLMQRYTAEHPLVQAVDRRISELEQRTFPAYLAQLVQQLQIEEGLLAGQVATAGANLQEIPVRSIQEAQLRRDMDLAEEFYSEIQRRYQISNLQRASSIPDVRILDPAAAPDFPTGQGLRAGSAGAAFLAFLALGAILAIILDRVDSRLRTPDQVTAAFGLNVLGAVPRIERANGRKHSQDIRNVAQVYEAFRGLRTNLIYAYGSAGPIVLTISSPGMNEGKTTIATNLGIAFAELGRRTLLIDADTRRGDMHHYLDGRRKPGLTDYLGRSASADEVLQGSSHEGLDFIGSGTQVANSPELLSSNEMGRMMASLRKQYDVILIDSPPLGAGADPLVLSTITGHLMLVVRSGSTDREFTHAKLDPLNRLPVRLLGAVVNDYEPSRIGDGYQYYASYLPGYEAGAEEAEARLAAVSGGAPTNGESPSRFGDA